MRPHQPTSKSKAGGIARARMVMKSKLWWLSGFPHDGAWLVVPWGGGREAQYISLTRDHLRHATRAITTLRRDYPRALPAIVGDVDSWFRDISAVLEALKPWVHDGRAPEPFMPGGTRFTPPPPAAAPATLYAGFSWMLATRANVAGSYLEFLRRYETQLAAMMAAIPGRAGVICTVQLTHLAASVGDDVMPLLSLLANPQLHATPTHALQYANEAVASLKQNKPASTALTKPAPALSGAVRRWPAWLLAQSAKVRRRFLELLACCDLRQSLGAWTRWLSAIDVRATRAHNMRDGYASDEQKALCLAELRVELTELAKQRPQAVLAKDLDAALQRLSADDTAWISGPLRDALTALGSVDAGRAIGELLRAATALTPDRWISAKEAAAALNARRRQLPVAHEYLARYVNAHITDADALAPWPADPSVDLLDNLIRELPPRSIERFFAALTMLHGERSDIALANIDDQIVELCRVATDVRLIVDRAKQLWDADMADTWLDQEVLRYAIACCARDNSSFPALVTVLKKFSDEEISVPKLMGSLMTQFAGAETLLCQLLLEEDNSKVIECGQNLTTLGALGLAVPAVDTQHAAAAHAWIAEFPEPLVPALQLLAGSMPNAQLEAERILASEVRPRDALEKECAALEARIESVPTDRVQHLQQRLDNLRNRLSAGGDAIPQGAMRRVDKKLRRRAAQARVETLIAATRASLSTAATRILGQDKAPDWLRNPRSLRLFGPILELAPHPRKLGRQLLQLRCGPPPWDLREHPQNASFLENLATQNVDTRPWVEGVGTVCVRDAASGKGARALNLTLEDDPLELFHMGGLFKTCLSPGSFNFFSVVANIADINKRVLFARDANTGAVIGRRLLCLTDQGSILAFHAYCHDGELDFEAISSAFVCDLAEKMRATVAADGTVRTLVADDWYDDGAVDVAGQLDFLEQGSEFRKRLAESGPVDLDALLRGETGTARVGPMLAAQLIALQEFAVKPGLAAALLHLIDDQHGLTDAICTRLAVLIARAEGDDRAIALFGHRLERILLAELRADNWLWESSALELLARTWPSATLRILRRTRPRGVRQWQDEPTSLRLLCAAIAMETLKRANVAAAIYAAVEATNGPGEHDAYARERLAALAGN